MGQKGGISFPLSSVVETIVVFSRFVTCTPINLQPYYLFSLKDSPNQTGEVSPLTTSVLDTLGQGLLVP